MSGPVRTFLSETMHLPWVIFAANIPRSITLKLILGERLQKPFGGAAQTLRERIFDYRVSRARRTVENAFGVMASRFRILRRPIALATEYIQSIVQACCVLHNFLRRQDGALPDQNRYLSRNMVDEELEDGSVRPGEWRAENHGSANFRAEMGRKRKSDVGMAIQQRLADYFMSPEGSSKAPWQYTLVNRGTISE